MAYFLDLFTGDPAGSGVSVLSMITGSSTRPDITSALEEASYPVVAITNTVSIVVSTGSLATTNVSWVGLYNAASGGTLLFSAPIGSSPTINKGNPVRFDALALSLLLVVMITQGGVPMATESGVPMVGETEVAP